jgi:hypothetical protein
MIVSIEAYADLLEPLDEVERYRKLREFDLPPKMVAQIERALETRAHNRLLNAAFSDPRQVPAGLTRDELVYRALGRSVPAPMKKPLTDEDRMILAIFEWPISEPGDADAEPGDANEGGDV